MDEQEKAYREWLELSDRARAVEDEVFDMLRAPATQSNPEQGFLAVLSGTREVATKFMEKMAQLKEIEAKVNEARERFIQL